MCPLTPKERAAAQLQLNDAIVLLNKLALAPGNALDDKLNGLSREALELRRKLAEYSDETPADDARGPGRADNDQIDRPFPVPQPRVPAPKSWMHDFTLHPIARLLIGGMCILAWMIQPEPSDSALSTALLMFLRSVPMFVIVGSACGRALTGTLVGVAMYFGLMWAESMSVVIWDGHLSNSSLRVVRHATRLANLLYLLGGLGLVLCVGMTLALRRKRWMISERYFRMSTQILALVQLAIVLELGYTGLRHFIGADQKNVGTIHALLKLGHSNQRHR